LETKKRGECGVENKSVCVRDYFYSKCLGQLDTVLSYLKQNSTLIDGIVLSSRWVQYEAMFGHKDIARDILFNTLTTLTRMDLGNKTIVVGPRHMYGLEPLRLQQMQKTSSKTLEQLFQAYFLVEEVMNMEKLLQPVVREFPEVTFFSGYSSFCSEDLLCKIQTEKGEQALRDSHHWTLAGMQMYGKMMREKGILPLYPW